jgi:hypothetical protein
MCLKLPMSRAKRFQQAYSQLVHTGSETPKLEGSMGQQRRWAALLCAFITAIDTSSICVALYNHCYVVSDTFA